MTIEFTTTIDDVTLDDDPTAVSGTAVSGLQAYHKDGMIVRVSLAKASSPGQLNFYLEFSEDGSTWYKHDEDGWGAKMLHGDSITNTPRIVWKAPILGSQARIRAVAPSGSTDASNTFTLTVEIGLRK